MPNFKLFDIFIPRPEKPMLPASVVMRELNGRKYINKMPALTGDNLVYLESFPTNQSTFTRTSISGFGKKQVAYHDYDIYNCMGELSGSYMETEDNLRNLGLGELLRLASIIEMKENDLHRITLFSKSEAIKFHYKYGFRPNIKDDQASIKLLKEISYKTPHLEMSENANELRNTIEKQGYIAESQCKQANDIVNDYMLKVQPEKGEPILQEGLDMVLTAKDVKANSSFYNSLFEKHKIDYRV